MSYIQSTDEVGLYILKDFHVFMRDNSIVRSLRDVADSLKTTYKTLIIISPTTVIPPELEKDITVMDFELPDYDAMKNILDTMINRINKKRKVPSYWRIG